MGWRWVSGMKMYDTIIFKYVCGINLPQERNFCIRKTLVMKQSDCEVTQVQVIYL